MKRIWRNMAGLLWTICLLFTGCSDGGSGSPEASGAALTSISGVVADGYLVGAKVCLDRNNNKRCDAGEPAALTTAGGAYTLSQVSSAEISVVPVLVEVTVGVVDEERGLVIGAYTLIAPAGRYTFISPLTALVQHHAETNNLSSTAAEQALRSQLGLTRSLYENYLPGSATADSAQKLAAAIARRTADALADAQASTTAAHPGWSAQDVFNVVLQQVREQLTIIVQQAQEEVTPPPPPVANYTVTPLSGNGGSLAPATSQSVTQGSSAGFTVTPNSGYAIASVSGCGGTLSGSTYTTGAITADCTVNASFSLIPPPVYTVTPVSGSGGSLAPATARSVTQGSSTSFTVTPNSGYTIASVSGCGGNLSGSTYTTGAIIGACTVNASFIPTNGNADFTW